MHEDVIDLFYHHLLINFLTRRLFRLVDEVLPLEGKVEYET